VVYGSPIAVEDFPKDGSRRDQVDALSRRIMERIGECVERAKELNG
jgi:hypothetical protein